MVTTYKYILIAALVGSFMGAVVAPYLIEPQIPPATTGISPLPKCGPEGHPDTAGLVIVLCLED